MADRLWGQLPYSTWFPKSDEEQLAAYMQMFGAGGPMQGPQMPGAAGAAPFRFNIPPLTGLPSAPRLSSPDMSGLAAKARANRRDYGRYRREMERGRPNAPLGSAPTAPTEAELQEDSTSAWMAGLGRAMGNAGNRGLGPILFAMAGGGFEGMAAGREAQDRRKERHYEKGERYLDRQGRAEDARARFEQGMAGISQQEATAAMQAEAAGLQVELEAARAAAATGDRQATLDYQQKMQEFELKKLQWQMQLPQFHEGAYGTRMRQLKPVAGEAPGTYEMESQTTPDIYAIAAAAAKRRAIRGDASPETQLMQASRFLASPGGEAYLGQLLGPEGLRQFQQQRQAGW